MGRLQASEFANRTDLDTGLRWHLQGNHFPPISLDFLPIAKEAIAIAKGAEALFADGLEDEAREDYQTKLTLPNGKILTVGEIIEGLHLEEWVMAEDSEGDDS